MEHSNANDFTTANVPPPSFRKRLTECVQHTLCQVGSFVLAHRRSIVICAVLGGAAYGLATHPPFQTVDRGELGLRINQWTGGVRHFQEGSVLVIPGVHELRAFPLRDQVYHPKKTNRDDLVFQTVEGLSIGVDFTVRYALDPEKIPVMARVLPDDISGEVVLPTVQDIFHQTLSRYTVREVFSARRQEIQTNITKELQARLAEDGIRLKNLTIGKIELPKDYMNGMEKLLAAEIATEQMRFTLELQGKKVEESRLIAEAEKVSREKAAEAAGQEQIIAAQAQAEAMKHILPFKERQIKQRALEAEADKVTRLKNAEASAEARRIEAAAEADSRKKLAEAEVFRLEQIGKVQSEQLAREGKVLTQNPLLIQKALADKLSDKISVIIAAPGANGAFIGENLIGRLPQAPAIADADADAGASEDETNEEE
ncbi:MAG: prohibitin family protein [Zoogloeaceae bacterium]|jgi:regulator of protease activity HflC (stomatin/prohibitin superfamily)|nr:prohibitin family protein [Zoogloeaceae bacterium]